MLRAGEISVVELAEAHIAQIERLNPQLNAFADFDAAARARAQARDAWRETRTRVATASGLPVTVKSSIATAGYRSARSAACCTRATCRAKMRSWWRGCARRER